MKIELNENKIYFNSGKSVKEIHPFWLRERISEEKYLDKGTNQRLFDPASLDSEIKIKEVKIKGVCEIANDNAEGQTIISGDIESINLLQVALKDKKKKFIEIKYRTLD